MNLLLHSEICLHWDKVFIGYIHSRVLTFANTCLLAKMHTATHASSTHVVFKCHDSVLASANNPSAYPCYGNTLQAHPSSVVHNIAANVPIDMNGS